MPLLETRGLCKNFGGLRAVNNLNLFVEKGEIVGLIGPNGAGKTTVFNLISGFLRPDEGGISFEGTNLVGLRPHEVCAKGIGRTFQLVKPFAKLSTFENVVVGALNRTNDLVGARELSLKILERLSLWEKRDFAVSSLTIADRKRLELARALATGPTLLLLDEVMAGLNLTEVAELGKMIETIRSEGVSILMIEHVMRAVMSISDRVVVVHHGGKIVEGTPEFVTKDPRVIEAYLGEADDLALS